MHTFEAKGESVFNFNPDLSGNVEITARNGRMIWVAGADLIEFMRHVESLKRGEAMDLVYSTPIDFLHGALIDMHQLKDPAGDPIRFATVNGIGITRESVTIMGVSAT